jgi:aldehyde:ferredoxin oxidoreductase
LPLTNRVLHIDLNHLATDTSEIPSEAVRLLLGGGGVGLYLWGTSVRPEVDPFAPENDLVISAGALTGTIMPGCAKVTAVCKNTVVATDDGRHYVACSVAGSRDFGQMMKGARWDHIVIHGQSERPLYVLVEDDEVQFIPAEHLWGTTGTESGSAVLREQHGADVGTMVIGAAGENRVRFSMAVVDLSHSLGRAGVGAVMGAKNLKALVVRGTQGVPVADPAGLVTVAQKTVTNVKAWDHLPVWSRLGMGGGWSTFRYTQYPGKWPMDRWDRLYGEEKRLESLEKVLACSSCHLGCRVKWRIPDGTHAGEVGYGSPYGKSATGGQLLGIEDINQMIHLVAVANAAGLDFYTWTRLTDWFTTLVDRGLVDADQPGIRVERTYPCYEQLMDMTIHREGIGSVLAEGWIPVAEYIGRDPQEYWYAGINKGTDFIYDARSARIHPLTFSFITNPRPHHGGTHSLSTAAGKPPEQIREQIEEWGVSTEMLIEESPEPKLQVGRMTKYTEDAMMVRNALGACSMYPAFGLERMHHLLAAFNAVSGEDLSLDQLMATGDRLFNLLKWLNVREGFRREDDRIPELWLRPMESPEGVIATRDYYGQHELSRADLEAMLEQYYVERGWNPESGCPTRAQLRALKLDRLLGAKQTGTEK